MTKYVFIQDDPFYLPRVLDKYLREFADTTAGINIQSVAQGKRSVAQTAMDLYRVYGFDYFQWKLRRYAWRKVRGRSASVAAVAKRYGIPVTAATDVNSEAFRRHLRDLGVELIVSISGTQMYRKALLDQTPAGIINCHGGLLPKYRGLMPSFWTLANGEPTGGVTVHFVDQKLDNGPIVLQRSYRILPNDSLESVMSRSKDLAAEAIIDAVRMIERGDVRLVHNDPREATAYSMPTPADAARLRERGHRFY